MDRWRSRKGTGSAGELAVELEQRAYGVVDEVVALDEVGGGGGEGPAGIGHAQGVERGGEDGGIADRHREGGRRREVGDEADGGAGDGQTAERGLLRDDELAFVARGDSKDVGAAIVGSELVARHRAVEGYRSV